MTETSNIQLYPGWRNAYDLFEKADFAYGHLVTDEWLTEAFSMPAAPATGTKQEFDRWELRFLSNFKRFEREVADRLSLCFERVQSEGYRVLHPKAHARRALEQLHHENVKALRRSGRMLTATRLQELTPAERMEHLNAMSLVARAKAATPRPREWHVANGSKATPGVMLESRMVHEG